MKYRALLDLLKAMDEKELNQDVTVYLDSADEYLPLKSINFVGVEQDVLDPGHCVFTV